MATLEKDVKYVNHNNILLYLLLTLNMFRTFLRLFLVFPLLALNK